MKYKVLQGFIDAKEDKNYRAGDEFIVGAKTNEARLEALLTTNNAINKPLIAEVDEAEFVDSEPVALEDLTVADLKELATEKGLEFKSKVTKAELVELLKEE